MRLTGQIVVITGGSSGLGKAVGVAAAKAGATVVLLARRKIALQQAQAAATAASGLPNYAYVLDVSDPVAMAAVVARIQREVGPIDALVNAAGFGHFEAAVTTKPALVAKMVRVNLLGTMYMTQLVGRAMVDAGHGHIINVASMAGKIATPKSAVYSATKFGVIGYSNALRLELRPFGVRVTTVNPGPIKTNFFAVAGAGDYLQRVAWLALDPEHLAARIVAAIHRPVREINAPVVMNVAAKLYDLFPRVGDMLAGGVFNRK
jgi:short-subunit dehydrogenase